MSLQARYTILRKIADGGTAEIFLATQRGAHGFEKPVVLKRIFPAFYADPLFRNMLVDEAHIAMSLNHSNIVQVLDLGESDGQYVLALELVDGWTLDAVLRRARALKTSVPPALALYMTAEVCRALAYAHAKIGPNEAPLGIVHRDISPHNLLLSEQGEVKLTDFGIAKAHNRRESSLGNIIKGKIAYMSPEQASGGTIDARSDLFSVGTMLYVMVCHRYPFDAPTDLEVLLLVKNGECEPPEKAMPGLNPEIYRVIKRAMAKAPADRYQRADEMLVDVEHVMRVAFRAVGQTELKRWLQDLSMRDGVPPLTRMPIPPSTTLAGRVAGETLELKGVGTTSAPATLPRPTLGPRSNPPPQPSSAPAGSAGRIRPPPPPVAMTVGKKIGAPRHAASGTPGNRPPGPGSGPTTVPVPAPGTPSERFKFGVGEISPESEESLSEDEATEVTPTPMPVSRPAGHHTAPTGTPSGSQTPHPVAVEAEPTEKTAASALNLSADHGTGDRAAPPDANKAEAGHGPPVVPRKSSSWVAKAVLASAQRAGTTPPPPIVNVVPPPPVRGVVPPAAVTAAPEAADSAPVAEPRKNPALLIASGLAVAAMLVIGLFVRSCHTSSAERTAANGNRQDPAAATKSVAPGAGQTPALLPAIAVVADAGAAADATAALPRVAVVNNDESRKTPDTGASEGVAAGATVSRSPAPAAGVPSTAPAAASPTGSATGSPAVAAPVPVAPSAVSPAAAADESDRAGSPSSESQGDADGGIAATVSKVVVVLSSSPAGAQVGTARRSFGTTPVSAKLKVGRTYNLIFTLDGYHSVTKQFRVANFADQEVTAVLRRETPSAKSQIVPAVGQPPAPQKPDKNWFQRMFAR